MPYPLKSQSSKIFLHRLEVKIRATESDIIHNIDIHDFMEKIFTIKDSDEYIQYDLQELDQLEKEYQLESIM